MYKSSYNLKDKRVSYEVDIEIAQIEDGKIIRTLVYVTCNLNQCQTVLMFDHLHLSIEVHLFNSHFCSGGKRPFANRFDKHLFQYISETPEDSPGVLVADMIDS